MKSLKVAGETKNADPSNTPDSRKKKNQSPQPETKKERNQQLPLTESSIRSTTVSSTDAGDAKSIDSGCA